MDNLDSSLRRFLDNEASPSFGSPIETDDNEIGSLEHFFIPDDRSDPRPISRIIGTEDLGLDPMGPGDLIHLRIESRGSSVYPYNLPAVSLEDPLDLSIVCISVSMTGEDYPHNLSIIRDSGFLSRSPEPGNVNT